MHYCKFRCVNVATFIFAVSMDVLANVMCYRVRVS